MGSLLRSAHRRAIMRGGAWVVRALIHRDTPAMPSLTDRPATIYDVAKRAGVSPKTVSRVINAENNVTGKTRSQVEQAIRELGFVPNPAAQTVKTRRTRVIEFVTTDIYATQASSLAPLAMTARDRGYQLTILPVTPGQRYDILGTISNRMPAGTIYYDQHDDLDEAQVARLVGAQPFVHMGGRLTSPLPSVTYDQYQAARLAIEHLIDCGHRSIACITGQMGLLDGQQRAAAWRDTLIEHGLPADLSASSDFATPSGYEAMNALLDQGRPLTAVAACTDEVALGVIRACLDRGLRVPDDISVIGYNDDTYAAYIDPPLTTITRETDELSQRSIAYLFEQIADPSLPRAVRLLEARLVIRQSVARLNR
jgi:DNA-binding LacI/PurR family transcriptional regulator